MDKISKQLPLVEKVFLTAVALGTVLLAMKINVSVVKASLVGLGVTFFLYAFRQTDNARLEEGEKFGFQDLLARTIIPKVLWISSAISSLGITFYLFDFGNDGYKRLLIIGGETIAVATIILVILLIQGVKYLGTTTPILLRAIPLALLDHYVLFGN